MIDDKSLNSSQEASNDEPFYLTEKQKELCRRLDRFYASDDEPKANASEMFRGALYTMQKKRRKENLDWMAQASHSLREILLPFKGLFTADPFIKYGTTDKEILKKNIGHYHGLFTSISHHKLQEAGINIVLGGNRKNIVLITDEIFEKAVSEFEAIMFDALRQQLDVHAEIDLYIQNKNFDVVELQKLLSLNIDAQRYFYAKATEAQLQWLWDKGFLDAIKGTSKSMPELDYLIRVSRLVPQPVGTIISSFAIDETNFDPKVIDCFLRICPELSAEELRKMTLKIRNERWVKLMSKYRQLGFDYKKVLDKLSAEKDGSSIICLAEGILEIKSKEEIDQNQKTWLKNPFYFDDLNYTGVFDCLASIDKDYYEEAFALAIKVFRKIIDLEEVQTGIFPISENFHLYDCDFFNLSLSHEHDPYDGNVQNLLALITILITKLIGGNCENADEIKRIFNTYIANLPNSRCSWRIRLFAMSNCPMAFRDELHAALIRIFDYVQPWDLISGAEYEWALQKVFPFFTKKEQRDYISNIIEKFKVEDPSTGLQLLSLVYSHLTDTEKEQIKTTLGEGLAPDYEPKPTMYGPKFARGISPRAPIDSESFSKIPIKEIVNKMHNEWTPEELYKQDTEKDYHQPLNAEGLSSLLKSDILIRPQQYIKNAEFFFDRESLDPHYTYSFLRGLDELLEKMKPPSETNWDSLIKLLISIVESGVETKFEIEKRRKVQDDWLVGWTAVHIAAANLINRLLRQNDEPEIINFSTYRNEIFKIISYLLTHSDPEPETIEEPEIDVTNGKKKYTKGDPYFSAVNSVRGQGMLALERFGVLDAKLMPEAQKSKLSTDLKELYARCLRGENTQAIMFTFGHHLPYFYFSDKEWLRTLLPEIFSVDPAKKDQYLAAWEGYLSRGTFQELWIEVEGLYQRAIANDSTQYSSRRYRTELDEGLANHLALAYIHYPELTLASPLFKLFWETPNIERHQNFVSFIGRHSITRENAAVWIKENNVDIEKIKAFWDWTLENCDNKEVLSEFGYWIQTTDDIFDVTWIAEHILETLKKSKGAIAWEYGLIKSLPKLIEAEPLKSLEILRLYLFSEKRTPWIYIDDEWVQIFKALFAVQATKAGTRKLINDLVQNESEKFWKLEEVIKENVNA